MKRYLSLTILAATVALPGCTGSTDPAPKTLEGAGSSFVSPVMTQWANHHERRKAGYQVNYQSTGSGRGIKLITERKIDFACSDAPMSNEELASVQGEIVHIPLVLGAVVPVYNLPEVKETTLRFTGPVLADIFRGVIKKWNEDPIRDLNPGVKLPDREIQVVHRSDSSGTTYIWTDYLSKVSPAWADKPGKSSDPTWPIGQGKDGNGGIAEYVKEKPGTIGYVELSYAYSLELDFGLVKNQKGEFIKAGRTSVQRAADNALTSIPDDLRFSLTDAPGEGSYPIAGTTWALVYKNLLTGKGDDLVNFLRYVVGGGQDSADRLFYVRLPTSLQERAEAKIDQIKVGK